MARLQGALDNDILIITRKFLSEGTPPNIDSLWTRIQQSNSSLKRKPKKVLQSSLERVLDFIGVLGPQEDSEAEIEQLSTEPAPDIMNRSLRGSLAPQVPSQTNGDGLIYPQKRQRTANGEPYPKRTKSDRAMPASPPSNISLDDIGGMDDVVCQMNKLLVRPLLYNEEYADLHVPTPRGLLLHGPPGCGKTMISRAYAAHMHLPLIEMLGPSIVSGMSGESERGIRDKFDEAKRQAPCIIFIDEIDAIAPKRDTSQSQMEKRIVAQLLVSMDDLGSDPEKLVIVLATTNRPDAIDPALRRGGRFDTEINIPVPNEHVRKRILQVQTRKSPLADDVDFDELARKTSGFVGSDLHDLIGKAGTWQLETRFATIQAYAKTHLAPPDTTTSTNASAHQDSPILEAKRLIHAASLKAEPDYPHSTSTNRITMSAFLSVLPTITPSSKREGFATIPNVSWSDIGALAAIRRDLQTAIVNPILHPTLYNQLGITAPTGILLWGPPGCGKTLLAKACAAESRANFISIKGPELLTKYLGDSEAAVRRVFARARSSVPCVIFFDELDALAPRRDSGSSGEGGGESSSSRIVNTLLTELDGLSDRSGIYVISATNRPDIIDPAMLRPGRLEIPLFVDLPDPSARSEILRTILRYKPVVADDVEAVVELGHGKECEGYSGADLEALVRQAGYHAIGRLASMLNMEDFRAAAARVRPSVGDIKRYYGMRERLAQRY
ncbi:hypothetical protein BAUCODRAFT_128259 [Baudoinia panamericana UAMH 10762]|uniref:AAA+ ATPase domain-containing protein n=1 Tax=Baudoinia panamericana (strain UAMH 10762) TaxID=717646 RepID=M2NP37_BAUPA|nr:uncharacterized protein BAUCODRAFT_128259 [Baudoinia panamericana UAMH 10762]EMD01315.1 hypothetical protein BAUCODRAFT_128259 [Baudoinia panamericana UAMH 10762]